LLNNSVRNALPSFLIHQYSVIRTNYCFIFYWFYRFRTLGTIRFSFTKQFNLFEHFLHYFKLRNTFLWELDDTESFDPKSISTILNLGKERSVKSEKLVHFLIHKWYGLQIWFDMPIAPSLSWRKTYLVYFGCLQQATPTSWKLGFEDTLNVSIFYVGGYCMIVYNNSLSRQFLCRHRHSECVKMPLLEIATNLRLAYSKCFRLVIN